MMMMMMISPLNEIGISIILSFVLTDGIMVSIYDIAIGVVVLDIVIVNLILCCLMFRLEMCMNAICVCLV
jgi:hypothetical protein